MRFAHATTEAAPEPFGTSRRTLQLIEASVLGRVLAVRYLLSQGADANAPTSCGYGPLHFAALAGRVEIVRILLEAGADPLHRGPAATLPAELAAMHGHREAAALLRERASLARGLREAGRVQPACLGRPETPLIPTRLA